MISINKENSRFTVKLGFMSKEEFEKVLGEFRKIDKRYWDMEKKLWSFPNTTLNGLCLWFNSNGFKYELIDPQAPIKAFRFRDTVALDIATSNTEYEEFKSASVSEKSLALDRSLLFFKTKNFQEILDSKLKGEEYKYNMQYAEPNIPEVKQNESKTNKSKTIRRELFVN
jgi:hypothetical protein